MSYLNASYGCWKRKRLPDVDRRHQIMQTLIARAIRFYEQEPGEPPDSVCLHYCRVLPARLPPQPV